MTCCLSWQTLVSGRDIMVGLSVCLLLMTAVGCGRSNEPPVGTVSGTVTFKGEPVPEGVLYVYNRETADASEGEIKDGKFELVIPVKTGTYAAFITPIPPPPPNPDNPPANRYGEFPKDIPKKYQHEQESDLKIEVEEGHNEVTIEIPSQ